MPSPVAENFYGGLTITRNFIPQQYSIVLAAYSAQRQSASALIGAGLPSPQVLEAVVNHVFAPTPPAPVTMTDNCPPEPT